MKTIYDYIVHSQSETPFLGTAQIPVAVVDVDFQKLLEQFIDVNYREYCLKRYIKNASETMDDDAGERLILQACDMVYLSHAYEYQKLYDSMNFEYNPIENYDMTEHESVENRGTDSTTTSTNGHTDTTTHDANTYTDTDNLGSIKNTSNIGQRTIDRDGTDQIAPFDTQDYNNLNKSFASETQQSTVDSNTIDATTNSYDKGARHEVNETEYGKQSGTSDLTHGHDITRDLTRNGNIGVTTTQQMIEQERKVSMFNLVRIVANDIIQTICSTMFSY